MKLTGKCKEQFEEWYCNSVFESHVEKEHYRLVLGDYFYIHSHSMKYGVYVDFFDSVGLYINKLCPDSFEIQYGFDSYIDYSEVDRTRPEARTKAIEKANELLNERL